MIILFYTICHLLIRIIWTILELHSNQLFTGSCLKVLHSFTCTYFLIFSNTGNCTCRSFSNFRNRINCPGKMKKMKLFLGDHMLKLLQGWIQKMWHGFTELALCVSYHLRTLRGRQAEPCQEHQAWALAGWCVWGAGRVWLGWGSFAGLCRSCQPFPDSPLFS